MEPARLPSTRVCSFASKFLEEWSADERRDFFALVAAANKITLTVEQIEKAITSQGNISRAATLLGYSRRTLQLHMRQLGMPASRGGRPKGAAAHRR